MDLVSLIALTIPIHGQLLGGSLFPVVLDLHLASEESRKSLKSTFPMSPEFSRKSLRAVDSSPPEPMQLGRARFTLAERLSRVNTKSCLYCGATVYLLSACPLKDQAHQYTGELYGEFSISHFS